MKPLLYQGIQPGGQLTITTEVENYPGFANGIQGPEMMVQFEKQAARMGADIRYGLATKVDFSGDVKKVWIDDEKLIEADAVIISTGASAKWLGIPSEERLNGFGVSACAVCDGFFFKGKEVAIVGAGDTAAEEAHYLSKMCTTVHMFVRKETMRASKVMQDRVLNTPNIKVYFNTETDEILGEKKVEGVRVINTKTNTKQEIPVSALTGISCFVFVLVFITRTPSTFFSPKISSVSVLKYTLILGVFNTLSCITLDARIVSLRTNICTVVHIFDK